MSDLLCNIEPLNDQPQPRMYDREVFHFDKEGVLELDGRRIYEPLPVSCRLTIHQREKEPYKVEEYSAYYHMARYETYEISIYKIEVIEDTSIISTIEDGMHVCFTPSERMRLWFTIN